MTLSRISYGRCLSGLGLGAVLLQLVFSYTEADEKPARNTRLTAAGGKNAVNKAGEVPGEWSQWRGPNRDGISSETGLLKEWPEDGPPLAWKSQGLGAGFSSVAVAGGRIFTMGKKDGSSVIVAVNAKDGSELWTAKVQEGDNDPNCTPTVDGNLVFGLGFKGELVCVEAASGKEVWRTNFGDMGGKMMSGWGYSESPLVDGDRLICTPGSPSAMLAAFDKRTGKVLWKTEMPNVEGGGQDGAAYSSIVIGNGAGMKQYVQLVGRGLIGVSAKDGKLLWGYNKIANGTANIPTPILQGDYVFCSTGYGTGAALLKLSGKGGKVDAEEVYFLPANKMQNHHGGMILIGKYVYCGHGHNEGFPLCIEMLTGKVMWRPGRGPGSGSAAIAYADGRLYFRYQDGTMALIDASPTKYSLEGEFKLASVMRESWPHPVIAAGKLYVRDQDVLMCYDIAAK